MKKNLGSLLAPYPMPATIVGAMVDGERFSASRPTVDATDWVDGLGL